MNMKMNTKQVPIINVSSSLPFMLFVDGEKKIATVIVLSCTTRMDLTINVNNIINTFPQRCLTMQ